MYKYFQVFYSKSALIWFQGLFVVINALLKMEIRFGVNVVHKNYKQLNSKTNTFTVAVLPHASVLMKMCIAQMEIFKALLIHAIWLAQLPEQLALLHYPLKNVLTKANVLILRISITDLIKCVSRQQILLEITSLNIVAHKIQRFVRRMSLPKMNSLSVLFLVQLLCK